MPGFSTNGFSTGFVLYTPITRNWTKTQWRRAEAVERRSLFFGFSSNDNGRSREIVCRFETADEAQEAENALHGFYLTREEFFAVINNTGLEGIALFNKFKEMAIEKRKQAEEKERKKRKKVMKTVRKVVKGIDNLDLETRSRGRIYEVYVNTVNGNDENVGDKDNPVQSLVRAMELLDKRSRNPKIYVSRDSSLADLPLEVRPYITVWE